MLAGVGGIDEAPSDSTRTSKDEIGTPRRLANLNWRTSRCITFAQYRDERSYGLQFQDGKPSMALAYEYTLDLQTLKDPIMQVVRDAGWNDRPVNSFIRPIGG